LNASPPSAVCNKAYSRAYSKKPYTQTSTHQTLRRIGVLAEETASHINNASLEQIEIWAERVLDAKTLDDVMGAH